MLAGYHRKDVIKYRKDKKIFDDALAEVRKLCNDEERFLPNLTTDIIRAGSVITQEHLQGKGKKITK